MPLLFSVVQYSIGAGVAQWLCNRLPPNDPGFESQWGRCKNRASRPLNDLVDGTLNTANQPTNQYSRAHCYAATNAYAIF